MSNNTVKPTEEASPSDTKMNKKLLNAMYRRRMACPQGVQQLWDAVKVIRYHRQVPSQERILKYMNRQSSVSEGRARGKLDTELCLSTKEVQKQLGYCVRDGLLLVTKRMGSKGSKIGVEQEGYKLPDTEEVEAEKHDWYCWECHRGGDVICCGGCNRVYHLSCISNLPETEQMYLCHICQGCKADENLDIKQSRLNRFLGIACHKLKDKFNFLLHSTEMLQRSINIGVPGAQIDIGAESWRTKFLVHRNMDIAEMTSKAKHKTYTHLAQFTADAHSIVHNVVIFHGVNSKQADTARQMLRDCIDVVKQIKACQSCYSAETTKPMRHWFCLPCRPPHDLVYAKSKQEPYWPAKVIKVDGEKYDVRFFGGVHGQATVDKSCVQPITTNPNSLQVERSASWSKACEELKRHQEMLNKDSGMDSSSSSDGEESVRGSTKEGGRREERFGESSSGEEEEKKPVVKKRRGRPPSSGKSSPQKMPNQPVTPPPVKKKRGRPPAKKSLPKSDDAERVEESAGSASVPSVASVSAMDQGEPAEETIAQPPRAESPTTSTAPKSLEPKKEEEEIVSSSCMEPQFRSCGTQTIHNIKKANKEVINKLRRETEELKTSQAEQIKQLQQSHLQEIASTKKKQWCYNCEQEAIYHCCWNTAYCSTECQQIHWQREHKRVCRRKR